MSPIEKCYNICFFKKVRINIFLIKGWANIFEKSCINISFEKTSDPTFSPKWLLQHFIKNSTFLKITFFIFSATGNDKHGIGGSATAVALALVLDVWGRSDDDDAVGVGLGAQRPCGRGHWGHVWNRGCGQPVSASRPWSDLGCLKRATPSCLGDWPNTVRLRRAGVWAPPGSRAGSPTATNR
jgi:hypothetical protein